MVEPELEKSIETEQEQKSSVEIIESDLEGAESVDDDEDMNSKKISTDNFKLFGLYDVSDVQVHDLGMRRYINLQPRLMVKSHGRVREKFSRGKIHILEIFANLIGVAGHRGKKHKIQTGWKTGKFSQNMGIVLDCLKIIEKKTKQNPVQVFVTAIENASPRDGVTVIEYGGARYPQAVDISPLRRVTMTIRTIVHGSYDKSFNKKKKIEEALAEEIINAYNSETDSFSVGKRKESEKQADSAR